METDNFPVRTGDRGTGGDGDALPDGAAGQREMVVRRDVNRLPGCLHGAGERLEGGRTILVRMGEVKNFAVFGRAPGRFVWICKEAHRRGPAPPGRVVPFPFSIS